MTETQYESLINSIPQAMGHCQMCGAYLGSKQGQYCNSCELVKQNKAQTTKAASDLASRRDGYSVGDLVETQMSRGIIPQGVHCHIISIRIDKLGLLRYDLVARVGENRKRIRAADYIEAQMKLVSMREVKKVSRARRIKHGSKTYCRKFKPSKFERITKRSKMQMLWEDNILKEKGVLLRGV